MGPQGDFLPGYVHQATFFSRVLLDIFFEWCNLFHPLEVPFDILLVGIAFVCAQFSIVASFFLLYLGVVESLVILVAVVIRGTI